MHLEVKKCASSEARSCCLTIRDLMCPGGCSVTCWLRTNATSAGMQMPKRKKVFGWGRASSSSRALQAAWLRQNQLDCAQGRAGSLKPLGPEMSSDSAAGQAAAFPRRKGLMLFSLLCCCCYAGIKPTKGKSLPKGVTMQLLVWERQQMLQN